MISIWKTIGGKMQRIEQVEENCWINMVDPDETEISDIAKSVGVEQDLIRAALDEEEVSYVYTTDEGSTLITIDVPIVDSCCKEYSTTPMGIIFVGTRIITVCIKESAVISKFENSPPKKLSTMDTAEFMLMLIYGVADQYIEYLRHINRMAGDIEERLYKSQRNREVVELLGLQKSLVFFSTSLKANLVTLEKVTRIKTFKINEDDSEMLGDVLIEVRQAIEMSTIFTDILSGTMDAYASIVSNNLNTIMKALTVITLILTIPTMVFSYYGMNLEPLSMLPFNNIGWFPLFLSIVMMVAIGLYFKAFHFSKKR